MGAIKEVVGHPNYYVEDNGNIYSLKHRDERKLKPILCKDYFAVKIDGKLISIAKIDGEAFCTNEVGPEAKVFHLDDDKLNNNWWNLVWATPSEIMKLRKVPIYERKIYLHGLRQEPCDCEYEDYSDPNAEDTDDGF